jgi:hypothetical protein
MLTSLLDRAKPQLLEALAKQKVEYPNISKEVVSHLNQTYFINDLKFGTWVDLRSIWLRETNKLADSPWELFEQLP